MPLTVRPAGPDDAPFLAEMLVAAAYWRPGAPHGTVEEMMRQPHLAHYVEGWPREGDLGVVAEDGGPVGAAWLRFLPADDPGYGFVDAGTPELSIGVAGRRRGEGVGTRLLEALLRQARSAGLAAVSLSVERDNPARRLYERAGFAPVGSRDGSVTMLLHLGAPGGDTAWSRALVLPDGTRILGRGIRRTPAPTPPPEFGLYLGVDAAPLWPAVRLDWPDFGLPRNSAVAVRAISEAYERARGGQRVEVACAGGRGRTGTALACMAVHAGVDPGAAVAWIRTSYDRHAVETPWQRFWVRRYRPPAS